MSAAELIKTLQEEPHKVHWCFQPVWYMWQGYTIQLLALEDSLKLGSDRVHVSAVELQQVADLLECTLPTCKMVDLRYEQARRDGLVPEPTFNSGSQGITWEGEYIKPWTITAELPNSLYNHLVNQSVKRQAENYADAADGLVEGVGKTWVITKGLDGNSKHGLQSAFNYGWHTREGGWTSQPVTSIPGRFVAQPLVSPWSNYLHNNAHSDPSQGTFALFAREALLTTPTGDEKLVDVHSILQDEVMSGLLSHEGPLPPECLRQPGVEPLDPIITTADQAARVYLGRPLIHEG